MCVHPNATVPGTEEKRAGVRPGCQLRIMKQAILLAAGKSEVL